MEKLQELINKCKAEIIININPHTSGYQTIDEYKKYLIDSLAIEDGDIDGKIYEKMKELNSFISIQFYPDSPVGYYTIYHYDIEKAIDEALTIVK